MIDMQRFSPPRLRARAASAAVLWGALAAPLAVAAQSSGTPVLRLQRIAAIGGDGAEEHSAFMEVGGIAVTAGGEIFVLDAGNRSVRVFDARGRFLRRFGRQGSGPGEFQAPVGIQVDSVVRVSELAQRRVSVFSLDGRHLRTDASPMVGDAPVVRVVPLRGGFSLGTLPARLGLSAGGAQRTGTAEESVMVLSPTGRADTLARFHSGFAAYHPRDAAVPFGAIDSHAGRGGTVAVLGDSLVAAADGYAGSVRWYRAGASGLSLIRTRPLPSRSRPVGDDDRRRMEREIRAAHPGLPRRLVLEPPPRISVASQALFSADGSLWIRNTAGRGHAHVWTVFDPSGEIGFRVELPAGFDLRFVRGDLLYGVARTSNDAPVVHVYRLVRR